MLSHSEIQLAALRGATFDCSIVLWENNIKTVPFDLTGYTVTVTVGSLVLLDGDGITITPEDGTIDLKLTPTQTSSFKNAHEKKIIVSVEEPDGDIYYPVSGKISFLNP